MARLLPAALATCCSLALLPALGQGKGTETIAPLDGFGADPLAWRFVGGEEFPGAKGALERDAAVAHEGSASLKLSADFRGGGAYVGLWKDVPDLGAGHLTEVRFWLRSEGVTELGVRLGDTSGQCHQGKCPPLKAGGEWQEIVLRVSDLVGGEHWGGANDGKWHGPPTGFGLNIGKGSVGADGAGAVWIADVRCVLSSEPLGRPTVLPCLFSPDRCRPGFATNITYRWDAEPMGRDYSVFVHVIGPDGKTVTQNDHETTVGTSVWSGRTEYEHTVILPLDAPEGTYTVVLGLYDRKASERGWDRQTLKTAEGVTPREDGTSYAVGTFVVDAKAPFPELGPPTLDLSGYGLTFSEEFDAMPDVSAWGPGTRWIAHTPYGGDFGDARFSDPEEGFPFTVADGLLRIEARKDANGWRAGLLCSVDPKGEGFSQQYGYFEMRAKLPPGPGTWPAFWLLGVEQLKDKSRTQIEIDVVEQYGVNPYALHTTVHLWRPDGSHWAEGKPSLVLGMTEDFHTYGVLVDPERITFYYDGVELRSAKTPEEAKVPLYLLVNLALGSGWPIDQTPNPSCMYVDYVRVYAPKGPA